MARNSTFHCKQFSIEQDRCAMKVCTDAMIFGAVASIENAKRILDIGTGTGLLALMIAQRNPDASIDAIEIEAEAVLQAKENFENSKFKHQISAFEVAVQNFVAAPYDVIVCNPPFYQASLLPSKLNERLAHHAESLNFVDLLNAMARLLKNEGRFNILLPNFEFEKFYELALKAGFFLEKNISLKNTVSKPVFRNISTFGYSKTQSLESKEIIIYQEDLKTYTADFQLIMKAFYIIF